MVAWLCQPLCKNYSNYTEVVLFCIACKKCIVFFVETQNVNLYHGKSTGVFWDLCLSVQMKRKKRDVQYKVCVRDFLMLVLTCRSQSVSFDSEIWVLRRYENHVVKHRWKCTLRFNLGGYILLSSVIEGCIKLKQVNKHLSWYHLSLSMERYHLTRRWKVNQTRPFLHGFNTAINLLCVPWSIFQYVCTALITECLHNATRSGRWMLRQRSEQRGMLELHATPISSEALACSQKMTKRINQAYCVSVCDCSMHVCMFLIHLTNKQHYRLTRLSFLKMDILPVPSYFSGGVTCFNQWHSGVVFRTGCKKYRKLLRILSPGFCLFPTGVSFINYSNFYRMQPFTIQNQMPFCLTCNFKHSIINEACESKIAV